MEPAESVQKKRGHGWLRVWLQSLQYDRAISDYASSVPCGQNSTPPRDVKQILTTSLGPFRSPENGNSAIGNRR